MKEFCISLLSHRCLSVFIGGFILLLILLRLDTEAAQGATPPATKVGGSGGIVVCVSPPAADVGAEILRQGGNAVDAAVATALAMAVTFPEAGNIGGGGFMMIWPDHKRDPVCIDYRETAPAACQADTFVNETATVGHKTVGVPGTIRGLELAHQRYGFLPWKKLVEPAVKLAQDGFAIDRVLADDLNRLVAKHGKEFREFAQVFGSTSKFAADDDAWREGDVLHQFFLGETLKCIAEDGGNDFYEGHTARCLLDEMKRGGGYITAEDLRNYKAVERTPVHGTFRGYDVYSSPPPSSGGTAIVTMLNILEQFPLKEYGRYSPQTLHLTTEAMRRAYADRARYLGDPDFNEIPQWLTTKAHAKKLAATIDPNRATPSADVAPEIELAGEGESTTHFSVVDSAGMAVSNTYTLQNSYGSLVVVRFAGFLLNNEMTDFNWKPGVTDRSGRIGTPANQIAPRKRMVSSQSPTFAARDGKLVLITGSPGGRTIPNTVLNVLLNVLEFDMDVDAAVTAPRTHHQWLPDVLRFEAAGEPEHAATVAALQKLGHTIEAKSGRQGDAHTILVRNGRIYAAADTRRTVGKAAAAKDDGRRLKEE